MDSIRDLVRRTRETQGRTTAEVARSAGVDFAHLYRFERGQRGMSGDRLARVLAALGLEVRAAAGEQESSPVLEEELSLSDMPTVP